MSSPILNMFEIIHFFKDVDKLNKCWRPNLYKIPMNEKIELKYKRSRLLRCDLVILKPWNTKSIERPKGLVVFMQEPKKLKLNTENRRLNIKAAILSVSNKLSCMHVKLFFSYFNFNCILHISQGFSSTAEVNS